MGEANRKRQTLASMLASSKGCIYCAGANPATTIEHMPPKSIFEAKLRPKGLEFPACDTCNKNTGHSDLVAAMLARMWPDADTEARQTDFIKLLRAVSNNVPDVLREMKIGRAGEKLARKQHKIPDDAHPFRANGPILNQHMQTFAAKLGFALFYEMKGAWVPHGGGVQVMWFSNSQAYNKEIPAIFTEQMPPPQTLQQGSKSVANQFRYSYANVDKNHLLYYASFNLSFAVAGVVALDRTIFIDARAASFPIFSPGDFQKFTKDRKRTGLP